MADLMLRFLACAALLCASPCFAQSTDAPAPSDRGVAQEDANTRAPRRDRFVISGDGCGASRYAHLVGEVAPRLESIALPEGSNVFSPSRVGLTTLEYKPARLNIVVNDAGRVVSVSCS
jgi:hypothetical protein